jgi:tetratricopeptide (TPR) repeat protein
MRTVFTTFVLLIVTAVPLAAQDAVSTARELYASARYDEALAALNSIRTREDVAVRPSDVRALEQVRSLCLLALGRASEAEEAIAAVVAVDPFYQPGDADAAPRVRAAFKEVRQRMLPEIASERYAAAKATYERKEHEAAVEQFQQAIALLDDPDMRGRLSDLRMLAAGFLELSVAAVKAAEAAKPVEPPPPPPPPAPVAPRIYTSDDTDATPPETLRQEVPKMPSALLQQARDRGVVEVVVDEAGRVESAAIRVSIHAVYDSMLIGAAADWKYRPATVNGQPVKFRKRIAITVSRR